MLPHFRPRVALVRGQRTSATYQEPGHRPQEQAPRTQVTRDVQHNRLPEETVRCPQPEFPLDVKQTRDPAQNVRFPKPHFPSDVEHKRAPSPPQHRPQRHFLRGQRISTAKTLRDVQHKCYPTPPKTNFTRDVLHN